MLIATGFKPWAGTFFGDGGTAEKTVAVAGIFFARTFEPTASRYMSRPVPFANVRRGPSVLEAAKGCSYLLMWGAFSAY